MPHYKRRFFHQRPALYFDENFSLRIISTLKRYTRWKKKFKFISAVEVGNNGRSDEHHFAYCRKKGYTLVTLDNDFVNDRKFPFNGMRGIVIIKASRKDDQKILSSLGSFLDFLNLIPLPKMFLGDSKFALSANGCVMWGRDARTRELKKFHIVGGITTITEIRNYFSY